MKVAILFRTSHISFYLNFVLERVNNVNAMYKAWHSKHLWEFQELTAVHVLGWSESGLSFPIFSAFCGLHHWLDKRELTWAITKSLFEALEERHRFHGIMGFSLFAWLLLILFAGIGSPTREVIAINSLYHSTVKQKGQTLFILQWLMTEWPRSCYRCEHRLLWLLSSILCVGIPFF